MMSKKDPLLPTLFQLQGRSPRSPKSIQRLVFGFPPQFTFPFGLIKHGPDVANCCDLEQSLIYNLKCPRQKGECSSSRVFLRSLIKISFMCTVKSLSIPADIKT